MRRRLRGPVPSALVQAQRLLRTAKSSRSLCPTSRPPELCGSDTQTTICDPRTAWQTRGPPRSVLKGHSCQTSREGYVTSQPCARAGTPAAAVALCQHGWCIEPLPRARQLRLLFVRGAQRTRSLTVSWTELCPPSHSDVEALAPGTSECDCIWL